MLGLLAAGASALGGIGSFLGAKEANKANRRPAYITEGEQYAVDRAREIAERPYVPYAGQRVAGLSKNEREASALARTGNESALGYLDKAGSELGKLEDFSGESLKKYMNPYTESVLSGALRTANEEYERERSRLENSMAGAWGGDRAAFAAAELERGHTNTLTDLTARTYHDAFESARQSFFQDQDRRMRAAQAYQSLGGDISRMNTQQIQDLMATGGVERLLQQADLDFDYQQFAEARDWDVNNLEPLLQALGTAQAGERNRQPEISPWGQALGAAATIAGAYFTGAGNIGKKPSADDLEFVTPSVSKIEGYNS